MAAAAATRLFRMSRPLRLGHHSSNSFSNSCDFTSMSNGSGEIRCFSNKGRLGKSFLEAKEAAASVSTSDCVLTSEETKTNRGLDLGFLLANVRDVLLRRFNEVITIRSRRSKVKLYVQSFIEKGIMDCRFFTLFAVAGSLLGSFLCYVEGCFLILESYMKYFHALSQGLEMGHLLQLLIEAIDMFLVATAMLVFGMGLHVLFVGSHDLGDNKSSSQPPQSNYIKTLPSCIGMNSIMQAKTKIGHAVVMILQVGVLEKFKSVPLVTGFDLACFAGAVFASSACIFLLSKIPIATPTKMAG